MNVIYNITHLGTFAGLFGVVWVIFKVAPPVLEL